MNLYNIDSTIKQILEQGLVYDEETGEVFFTSDDLDNLQMQLDDKLNNIIGYIKSLEMQADNMKAIKDDYAKRQKTYEKKADSLKKYLDSFMQLNNREKVESTNGVASYRKSKAVDIYDDDVLLDFIKKNPDYANIKYEPNKTAIKESIISGKVIPGAVIKENKNLSIK